MDTKPTFLGMKRAELLKKMEETLYGNIRQEQITGSGIYGAADCRM